MIPAISMQRLYFVQSVGSGKVPSMTPHWKGAIVVGVVSGIVATSVVVVSTVVGGNVTGQSPSTHNFLMES